MAATNEKGRILEDIVTKVHTVNGLKATPRQKFPALLDPAREREIDVLIEGSVGPYPFRIPVECKNWGEPVGIGEIDAYEGKLNDIGMSVRGAIYVSAGGYESGAVSKAKGVGMVLLGIDGLTADRLSQEAFTAVTGTMFVIPMISAVSFVSPHSTARPLLLDIQGTLGGTILDLVWKAWIEHESLRLEEVEGAEAVPLGWGALEDGCFAQLDKVDYRLKKEGHLLTRRGSARKAMLTSADGQPVLGHVEAEFDSPFGKFELQRVATEEELATELGREKPLLTSLTRVKTPRVMYDGPLGRYPWLPDDALLQQLSEIYALDPEGYAAGTASRRIDTGTDIGLLFEHPSITYVQGLRERLGATWDPNIWTVLD
jgi:hypothetical protein